MLFAEEFAALTAAARAITGVHGNGYQFFGLPTNGCAQ